MPEVENLLSEPPAMRPAQSNEYVAARFDELADLLDILGENAFKVRAYKNAARTLIDLDEPISAISAENKLDTLPGFGDAIQAKTKDILAIGTTKALEDARRRLPSSIRELVGLPGVGAKTIAQLYKLAGIDSIASLETALREQKLRDLPGMGEKTEAKLKESLDRLARYSRSMLLSDARDLAAKLIGRLSERSEVARIALAGGARRGVEAVDALVIVCASSDHAATAAEFTALPHVASLVARSADSVRVQLANGFEANLQLCIDGEFGAALHFFTGSHVHNERLQALASGKGLRIDRYGVFDAAGSHPVSGMDEQAVYGVLGLPAIPVELREDRGEIESAMSGTLPDLIEVADIRGDLHSHTNATDGHASIEEMAAAAMARGYEYLAITDHSQGLTVANGLSAERLRAQVKLVREASERLGFSILAGIECDIKPDGSMDLPDGVLSELDLVIGSVHSRFKQTEEEMTARIIRAIENPHVDLIAHPTGRLINQRDPYAVDIAALIAAAARTGTALEINSFPERQDLNDVHVRMAKEGGVRIAIDTDAHAPEHFGLIDYGVNVARRGWLEKKDVVNTLCLSDLSAWLKR